MKGLKKLVLATAVAAIPFAAQADLKAMDDTAMGDVTGQAGVTIELETKVDIGEFRYTDEGYLSVSNIAIGGGEATADGAGGVAVSGILDDIKIDIDILADGDALISVGTISGAPVDYAMGIGSVELGGGDSTLLASNILMNGQLGGIYMQVDTATDTLHVRALFNVIDLDMNIDFLGMSIEDLSVGGTGMIVDGAVGSAENTFVTAQLAIAKGTANGGESLGISIADISMDVAIGAINIGGQSIGSIHMDDVTISQTSLQVYGHDGNTATPILP